jgi:hypothetical protein
MDWNAENGVELTLEVNALGVELERLAMQERPTFDERQMLLNDLWASPMGRVDA